MDSRVQIEGRTVEIRLSNAASRQLARRISPLVAEMELYFSCLIRKKVRFRDDTGGAGNIRVNDRLSVRFRPVMTQHCGLDYEGDEPPLTDFPITRTKPYVPRWLRIDYRGGDWLGEFGYSAEP
jgi:hypothetical protein